MNNALTNYTFPTECSRCNAQTATQNWELSTSTADGTLKFKVPIGAACARELQRKVIIRIVLINLGIYLVIGLLSIADPFASIYLNFGAGFLLSAFSLTYLSSLRHSVGSKEIGVLSSHPDGAHSEQETNAPRLSVKFHNPDYQQKFASLNPEPLPAASADTPER